MAQDTVNVEYKTSLVDVSPSTWQLVESLASEVLATRAAALEELILDDVPRNSRLVAYLLSTRISDINIKFRSRIVEILGRMLLAEEYGASASEEVRAMLLTEMSGMRQREIFCILQVTAVYPWLKMHGKSLICTNQFAGMHLVDICANNKLEDLIRREALVMISMSGFTNCLPKLIAQEKRISKRVSSEETQATELEGANQTKSLLFSLQDTISILSEL